MSPSDVLPLVGVAGDALEATLERLARWVATALDAACAVCLHIAAEEGPPTIADAYPHDSAIGAVPHLALAPATTQDRMARDLAGPGTRDTIALPDADIYARLHLALTTPEGPLGTVAVMRPVGQGPFSAKEATFFATLAEGVALALAAARHQATAQRAADDRQARLVKIVAAQRAQLALHARTERETAQLLAQVRVAETRFRGLVESAPDGVLIVDETGRIESLNHQTEVLFGYQRTELIGQAIETLLPERLRARHRGLRRGYSADPHTRPMGIGLELYGRRRDSSEVPVEISLSPLHVDGEAPLIIATVRDVTEQRHAARQLHETAVQLARQKEELARSNRDLEQFAYVASHDLQEPLRMVASYTQLLARRYRGQLDADADEFIGYAVDGANRMRQLIQDLLAYSRVGRGVQDFRPVDCGNLIDGIGDDFRAIIAETGATLAREPLPTVQGDPTQLRQLFQNLIGNALKYRRPDTPPTIHIGAARVREGWHFTVRDNGIGLAPEHAERIFEIFQRLHTHEDYSGTGIGLAICKRIAERHDGRIWVESRPGAGATFHLILPSPDRAREGGDEHGG